MYVLVKCSSSTFRFNRFLKVATAASTLINEVFNDRLLSEFIISMLQKINVVAWGYLNESIK